VNQEKQMTFKHLLWAPLFVTAALGCHHDRNAPSNPGMESSSGDTRSPSVTPGPAPDTSAAGNPTQGQPSGSTDTNSGDPMRGTTVSQGGPGSTDPTGTAMGDQNPTPMAADAGVPSNDAGTRNDAGTSRPGRRTPGGGSGSGSGSGSGAGSGSGS
jgi:hypothetical protein